MADWFVVNVADADARAHDRAGTSVRFEGDERFPDYGINIRLLEPGQPNGLYHSESVQEDFLVISGECIAILDGEERRLRAWDFVHCPAGTAHIFVGAGEGPCAILMVGARGGDIHYPENDVAARHGASVEQATSDAREAYADWGRDFKPVQVDWPPE